MKTERFHTKWPRYLILGFVAMLAGSFWNLGWFMALPLITLMFPALIAVLTHLLFAGKPFGQKAGIYAITVVITDIARNLLYVRFGQGLDYLLHDGETQLAVMALFAEELILGMIIIGILTAFGRRR